MEETKSDFGEDYNIVGAKFYNLKATLLFIIENFTGALADAEQGLKMLIAVKASDQPQLQKSIAMSKRDLNATMIRSKGKIEKRNAMDVRAEQANKPIWANRPKKSVPASANAPSTPFGGNFMA